MYGKLNCGEFPKERKPWGRLSAVPFAIAIRTDETANVLLRNEVISVVKEAYLSFAYKELQSTPSSCSSKELSLSSPLKSKTKTTAITTSAAHHSIPLRFKPPLRPLKWQETTISSSTHQMSRLTLSLV